MVKLHKHIEPEVVEDIDTADEDLTVHVSADRANDSKKHTNPESDENDDKVYFMALGGLEHVGQNMYVYKYRGKYLIVDCGMGFLEEEIGAGDVQY